MPLLNYSTQINAEKTSAEIQTLLARAKAQAVMVEYDDQCVSAYSFRIQTKHGLMTFRLPVNVQMIYQVIVRDRKIPSKLRTREQASRVALRIVKDWLEAQLAIIHSEMVDLEQIFLPFAQSYQGDTLYETLKKNSFVGLTLTDK